MWSGSPLRVGAAQPERDRTEAAGGSGADRSWLPERRTANEDCQATWHAAQYGFQVANPICSPGSQRFGRCAAIRQAADLRRGAAHEAARPAGNASPARPGIVGRPDAGEGGWGEEKYRLRVVAEGRHSTPTEPQLVRQSRSA